MFLRVLLHDYYDTKSEWHLQFSKNIFWREEVRYWSILEKIHCQNETIAYVFFSPYLSPLSSGQSFNTPAP